MRGIVGVLAAGFVGVVMFVVVAPSILEPIVQFVTADSAVQNYDHLDATAWSDSLLTSTLVWGPLLFFGASVVWAIRWYLRRERLTGRRVR